MVMIRLCSAFMINRIMINQYVIMKLGICDVIAFFVFAQNTNFKEDKQNHHLRAITNIKSQFI